MPPIECVEIVNHFIDKEFEYSQENIVREGSDCDLLGKLAYTAHTQESHRKGPTVENSLLPSLHCSFGRCIKPSLEFEPVRRGTMDLEVR